MTPWKGTAVGSEVDDAIEKMAHVALTSLCERSLAATTDTLLALFLICNQEEPEWQQHHEAMCDITSLQFSYDSTYLAKYTRYLFNLQHKTGRMIIEQRAHLNTYSKQDTLTSHTMEKLEHENTLLYRGTHESTEKDVELQVAYRCLSETEHELSYTRQQIDLAREEVDTRTHAIVHLTNVVET
jgi:hypothetical protein